MVRALCVAMAVFVLPLGFASADDNPDRGENAALKYWQAFATMPKLTDAEQNKLAGLEPDKPLDVATKEILTQADYALQMMHRGAALRHCDWGITYEDGVFLRLPQGSAARALTSLARLRAGLRFQARHNVEAMEDIVAAMSLGRHVSQEGGFIPLLMGYAIEHRMGETLARFLPKLDPTLIKILQARLDALPPFASQSKALMTCEKESMDWFIRKVKETKDRESLLAFLGWIGISEGKDRDKGSKALAFLQECGGTAEGVIRLAEEVRPYYPQTAKMLSLPLDEFEKEFERESRTRAANPVYRVFFPALAKVRRGQARAELRRTLLSAALAVQLDGPGALKNHPDPVHGGLLEYVAFEGGFELRTKQKGEDDMIVTLTVGQRGK